MNDALTTIEQARSTALDLAIRFGPKLLTAVVIVVMGIVASRWAGLMLARGLKRLELEPPVHALLVRIVRIAVLVLFLVMALQNIGVELLPLMAGLGVLGVGVALAMQGLLSDVAAGLSIIFSRPFRVGEYISISDEEGLVQEISLFNTTLSHPSGSQLVIPNRKIVGEIFHNFGASRQLSLTVGVAYDTDLSLAMATIHEVLRANPRVRPEPAPLAQPVRLAEYYVEIAVKPWVLVRDCLLATGEINQAIVETFRRRGIEIPFPRHDLRVSGDTLVREVAEEIRRFDQTA